VLQDFFRILKAWYRNSIANIMDNAIGIFMENGYYFYSSVKRLLQLKNVYFTDSKDYEELIRELAKLFEI